MVRFMVLAAMAAILTPGVPSAAPAPSPSGPWQVDTRHSDVQLITDATTDFGKTKINYTAGYARINGEVKLDSSDPSNSKFDLHIYPADAMAPPIGEQGKMQNRWMADLATHTLICFHSKQVKQGQDGKLQVTGDLVLTRVDRNVELEPTEAYSGPTYGPPIIHRVVREATFVFDAPAASAKDAALTTSGSTSVAREGFPQLVKAVLSTYWPPVVQDAKCQNASGGTEDYRGASCSGSFMQSSGLPPAPTRVGEDYPGASDFNAIIGNQLMIVMHLRLTAAGEKMASAM
jgi:polyisoprenoid-binding protein YceI